MRIKLPTDLWHTWLAILNVDALEDNEAEHLAGIDLDKSDERRLVVQKLAKYYAELNTASQRSFLRVLESLPQYSPEQVDNVFNSTSAGLPFRRSFGNTKRLFEEIRTAITK